MFRALAATCLLLATLPAGPARADLIYFAQGGQAQLPTSTRGDKVRIEAPGGPRDFDRADLLAIVPGHDPVGEWPERRTGAVGDGRIEAIFAASWWALENGLSDEAASFLRANRLLAQSTGHRPSLRALEMLDRLEAPRPDRLDLGSIASRLRPSRFSEIRGDHVLLLHQGDAAEARRRLEVLERVVVTFLVMSSTQGIDVDVPDRKLVSVWFADQRDYASLLRRSDAAAFSCTQGFYHPTLRTVFAFDTRSSEAHRGRLRAIANRKNDGASGSEIDRLSLLLELDWRATDLGIAAHETVHQLADASGFCRNPDDFPAWLHEGLAAQFEVVRGGRWAGVGRINDLRMPDWRSIRPGPRLAPLLLDEGFATGYRRDSYAQSWALVYFLRKARPAEFLTWLDRLRNPGLEAADPHERALLGFRAAFGGDVPALERAWKDFLLDLRSPLEEGRPPDVVAGPAGRRKAE